MLFVSWFCGFMVRFVEYAPCMVWLAILAACGVLRLTYSLMGVRK